ncbi:MAG: helix-turn-helix transcriptional regulator [Clostridia bacterium]|nr:helix-turn-helix transcriptional regulator [Clostridia bacterium]
MLYERIRALREDKDLSQTDMAHQLSVAQTTYSDYELGKINIPIEALRKLALFHDTSIDYLLELTDNPTPYERK